MIESVDGGDRQLGRIAPGPGVVAVTVDHRLHVDLSAAFEVSTKKESMAK